MPHLTKQAISSFFRSSCQRRLRLDLSPDTTTFRHERVAQNMPPRVVGRPGLQALTAAGTQWEREKVNDLVRTFGIAATLGLHSRLPTGAFEFSTVPLGRVVHQATPGTFMVQAEYTIGATFESAVGIRGYRGTFGLSYGDLRPDLLQVLAPSPALQQVQPDGSVTSLPAGDSRLPLRVIDIKLTAEPSVPYLAEVTYYAIALAGWLVDNNLDTRFFVVPEGGVWPGSHDASAIVRLQVSKQAAGQTPTQQELVDALAEDIEVVPFGVFGPRLRRFFQHELSGVLSTPWPALEWHVDNRCIGCEYLGFPWPGNTTSAPGHCWPTAIAQDHLSRVAFVSRGARGALVDSNINSVAALAGTAPTSPAYDTHHVLRATRTVVAGRAQSLASNQATVPPHSGTSAVMPRWADLRIHVTADFDVGSGITIAFGLKGFYWINPNRVQPGQAQSRSWQASAFPVDHRSLPVEERELLRLLNAIHQMLHAATQAAPNATVQVYVWDTVTYEHLVRVIGRHLPSIIGNGQLRHLAWLFPPETVVANPEMSDRKSPLTIVRDVIRSTVAAPVPHYYSLLSVARVYHSPSTSPPFNLFQVPGLFEDPLSDHVPSERAHEIWSRAPGPRPWNVQLRQLESTVRTRLGALESITQRVEQDLGPSLSQTAPRIADLGPPSLPRRMSHDGRLWFVFAHLNSALDQLDIQQVRAMPPHEREARYRSACLTRRLQGAQALAHLTRLGLPIVPGRWVFEMAPGSREVRARENDIGFALAPSQVPGFLDRPLAHVIGNAALPLPPGASTYSRMERVAAVSVVAVDRDSGIVVLDISSYWAATLAAGEAAGHWSFAHDVMLDPVHQEFFLNRLKVTLNAIGSPPVASTSPAVALALGGRHRPQVGQHSPVADVLWNGRAIAAATTGRLLPPTQALLSQNGVDLNPSQWTAWNDALSKRLHLIWGPPGTGKSRTLRAIVLGALHEASQRGVPTRVLVSGFTYEAIDNVLLEIAALLAAGPLALPQLTVARLRSASRSLPPRVPPTIDVVTGTAPQGALVQRLRANVGLTLVGGPVQQIHKLLVAAGGPVTGLFDLIVIDEASQVDVGNATLALSGLAIGGSVVVAGDPKQLPPIHKAEAPVGLESFVGPVFTYLQERHHLQASVLDTNYRSNAAIVSLGQAAGYPLAVQAHSGTLSLDILTALPTGTASPHGWPAHLFWTGEWAALLDPSRPCSVFVYDEGRSSQWNPFEADAASALTWMLLGRLASQLENERDPAGNPIPRSTQPYGAAELLSRGLGVVTPHRAQQALVITGLQRVLGTAVPAPTIREAVDTVERFQGQQRDVIIATFALGDPDAISDEDEFLLSLNRFNVMASRARAKLVVLVSRQVVDHMSADPDVLRGSALLKTFVETFCSSSRPLTLGYFLNGTPRTVTGEFRWR